MNLDETINLLKQKLDQLHAQDVSDNIVVDLMNIASMVASALIIRKSAPGLYEDWVGLLSNDFKMTTLSVLKRHCASGGGDPWPTLQ